MPLRSKPAFFAELDPPCKSRLLYANELFADPALCYFFSCTLRFSASMKIWSASVAFPPGAVSFTSPASFS